MIGTLLTQSRCLAGITIGMLLLCAAPLAEAQSVPPAFTEASVSGGKFNFALRADTGEDFFIEFAADLTAPQWTHFKTITTTGAVTRLSDTLQTNSSRIYRAGQHFRAGQENQVYAVNSVGYVNRTVAAGTNLIANPLYQTNNLLSSVLSSAPHGAIIRRVGPTGWNASVYISDQGWIDGATFQPSTVCLNPGEGSVLTSPASFSHTFVGEVPLGQRTTYVPAGWSLCSSPAFKSGRIITDLGFPAEDGDVVVRFDPVQQMFEEEYWYFGDGDWYPSEPVLGVGEAFWIFTAASKVWFVGSGIPIAYSGAGFQCSGGNYPAPGCAAAGSPPLLGGNESPGILVQPRGQTVPSGTNVTFTVDACGTPPLRYQWRFNGTAIGGATNFSLTLSNVQTPNIGNYTVAISNAFGAVTSAVVSLIVISTEPIVIQSLQALPNGDFRFSFNSQPGLHYQVEYTSDLDSWTALLSIVGSGTGITVIDPSAGSSARFYRVREEITGRYSANVVGYANVSISSQWQVIANPLRFSALNEVSDVLPQVPDMTELLKVGAAGFDCSFYSEFDAAWFDCSSPPAATLSPGEGAILRSEVSSAITFIGEVFEGSLTNKLPAGLSLCGSIVPQAGPISSLLGFPAEAGDVIYKFDPITDTYAAHTYLGNGNWSPSEPAISVGEGFWAKLVSAREWVRQFSTGGSALRAYTITNRPYLGPTGDIVPQPPPSLFISHLGSQVTVSWNAPAFLLQQAVTLSGPWTDVFGTSPYTAPITGPGRFFRLRHQTLAEHSENVVGYINVAVPAGKRLINNPFLSSPDNSLASVLPVVADLTVLYKVGGTGFDVDFYESGAWFDGTLTLGPGEGALLDPETPFTATFVGEIVQGALTNKLPAGLSVCSVLVPISAPITSQLGFPAENGDALYRLNPFTQTYEAYNYIGGSWQPQEPVPDVGEAFWVELGSARTWVTQFSAEGATPGYCVTNPPYNGPRDPMFTPRVPPTIYSQPRGQTNRVGTVASFSVGASGSLPLSYRWRLNNAPIPGATNSTLTISNVQPAHAGNYTVVITNLYGAITSTPPARLGLVSLCAIASTSNNTYPMRAPIPIQLRSIDCTSSNGLPGEPVTVYIRTIGTTRTLSATTDASGLATVIFNPLVGEAGHYEIAAVPAGQTNPASQASFDIIGMSLDASGIAPSITVNLPVTNYVPVRNLTHRELTGITAAVVGAPPQLLLQATMTGPLPAYGTNVLVCVLRGLASVAPSNYVLRATSTEGAANDVVFNLGIAPTTSRLVVAPPFLNAPMLQGTQSLVTFYVTNTGGVPANQVRILLPEPPPPWMSLVSPGILSLPPRASAPITLSLTPSNTLPVGSYFGNLVLQSSSGDTPVPYQFDCVQAVASTLRVTVEDEFTYLAEGAPRVSNAQIKLLDPNLKTTIATTNSDANGVALFAGLAEGYYEVSVRADGHEPFDALLQVTANQTNEVSAFVARNLVSYRWIVTTQEISDRYIFTLDARFQTDVPAPVIRVEPGALDLCQYPMDSNVVNLTIYNSGLIAARDARLTFGSHSNYVIRPVTATGQIGDIPARSNVVVPVLILRVPGATNPAPSYISAQLDWVLPLPGTEPRPYQLPISVYNAGPHDCDPGSPGQPPIWGPVLPPTGFGVGGPGGSGGGPGGSGGGPGGSGGSQTSDPPIFVTEPPDILTVEVGIQLSQTAVMTRQAFEAALELVNESTNAITSISITLRIRDTNGLPANNLFGIRPPQIRGLGAVDGSGSLPGESSGEARWIIIPATNAAPNAPTRYTVGGGITFQHEGKTNEIVFFDVPIVVLPDARLLVDYFLEQLVFSDDPNTLEIEPPVPFHVGLHLRNVGSGTANDVRVNSSQPQIVDNLSGLFVNFQLLGTQVNTQSVTPSLTADLGDILPGSNAVATWSMAASLQGRFVNYNASFVHLDDLGKMNLSLVDSIRIHPMVHVVRADVPGDDGILDYLANDANSPTLLADRLYLCDGQSEPVTSVTNAVHNGPPGAGHTNLQLTFTPPTGWMYLRIPNPSDRTAFLTSVRRSDGRMLIVGTNVWTTRRIVYPSGADPYLEDFLHLLDRDSTGSYTLGYGLVPVRPSIVSHPVSRTNIAGSNVTFTVSASGTEPLAFQWYHNGTAVPDGIFSVLSITNIATNHAGVYFVTVSNAAGSTNSASAILTVLAPPRLDPVTNRFVVVGRQLVITNRAFDPDLPIIFSLGAGPSGATITPEGIFRWTPTCAQGSTVNQVTIWARDSGSIPLSNSVTFTITVPECIEAGLGSTNVFVGRSSSVPVLLISTVALTNMAFTVVYPPERFSTNFALEVNSPQVLTQSVRLLEPGQVELSFTLSSNAVLRGPTNVAQFRFTALLDQSSAFVALPITDIDARKPDGAIVANAFGSAGRVIVIGVQPLLEARRGVPHPLLTVYANTGISYTLQTALQLPPGGPWSNAFPIILTNSFKSFDWTNQDERSRFFRVTLP